MWGKRIVDVQNTKNAMALALYLTSDVRKDKSGDTKIKGVTVNNYEKGMKVYRCSRGLKKPIAYKQGNKRRTGRQRTNSRSQLRLYCT